MNSGSNQSEKNRARTTAGNGAATSRQVAALTTAAARSTATSAASLPIVRNSLT
jgi:hypothetical protein